jgi:solute carrier family 39 (zinc transporter), member 1/2/3
VSGDSFLLTLFAVVLFHQMFEGMALGSCIAALGSSSAAGSVSGSGSGMSCHSPAPHGTAAATDDYEALPTAEGRQHHGLKAAGSGTGIGSGTTKVSTARKLSLAAVFALVTPAGMAIGIGVLDQFNGNDPQTIVAIGVLDALSAGILLWVGIVEMWAADWAVVGGAMVDAGVAKTVTGLGALVAGMVAMSVLGKWA